MVGSKGDEAAGFGLLLSWFIGCAPGGGALRLAVNGLRLG